jgi:TRAP-type transport system periplasmic protein
MPALDQGVIDGTISALPIFVAFKMNNLVTVVTVANDTYIVTIAMVSKKWLDSLPPDLAKLVIDTGRSLQAKGQDYEIEFSKGQEKEWNAMGGSVHALSPADEAEMKRLVTPVGDEVTKDQPAVHAMLEDVRAIAAKH